MSEPEKFDGSFEELLNKVAHEGQPHTILGARGQQMMTLKDIQIAECFLRGMLDGATYYNLDEKGELTNNIRSEFLEYHHLIDLIYKVKWLTDFDPVAIVQNASCHMEKVLGIFPNVPGLKTEDKP